VDFIIFTSVLFIIIALEGVSSFFFFSKRQNKKDLEFEENVSTNKILCRFVIDGTGRKIGESIAIDEDIVIIKSGVKYLGIPLKHIEENNKKLLVKGLVDFDKAEEMGEKWQKESLDDS
jgi:hypothetical protein